jgi:uncharacterized protein YyaL (SSP411 family)
MNRLAEETSPYLRQHKDNPVDWYPWGEEAFARAREEDRPILLSVGYSACHWCHVMAHESFEDPATARVMNVLFVNVKVDREERPDVDAIYMEAVQAVTGRGGWPMTVFLLPDGRPFYGGTYIPRDTFQELMSRMAVAWNEHRDELEQQAGQLAEAIRAGARVGTSDLAPEDRPPLSPALLDGGYQALRSAYDPEWGGFGGAPKFPQPTMIELCLRAQAHNHSPETTGMITTTLDAMASGGIYDHVGGGFARYSTDRTWLVPHFEKMLYDNAQLALAYLHAWQLTGEARYRQVVTETLDYLLAPPMRSPAGGIHSAEDADSEGVEGKFYLWSYDEARAVAPAALEWYGVTKEGNWEGHNILHRPVRGDLLRPAQIEEARQRLFEVRAGRVRPGLDDKVLTEWNAMAAAALATAGAALGEARYLAAAQEVGEFLLRSLRDGRGRWLRSWQGGRARHLAYAVDHAWLVEAFTRLGESTGQAVWIAEARSAADDLLRLFWDQEGGGLFTTGDDAERLIVRSKDLYDGATPSANSVAAVALLRLGTLTGVERYTDAGSAVLSMMAPLLARHPMAFTNFLAAADLVVSGPTEVAVVGPRRDLVSAVHSRYLPNTVLAWGERYDSPLWEGRRDGFAYVCRDYACQAPAGEVATLLSQLGAA